MIKNKMIKNKNLLLFVVIEMFRFIFELKHRDGFVICNGDKYL